eukprot:2317286-Alexandrium_andersonii.AAC.1
MGRPSAGGPSGSHATGWTAWRCGVGGRGRPAVLEGYGGPYVERLRGPSGEHLAARVSPRP